MPLRLNSAERSRITRAIEPLGRRLQFRISGNALAITPRLLIRDISTIIKVKDALQKITEGELMVSMYMPSFRAGDTSHYVLLFHDVKDALPDDILNTYRPKNFTDIPLEKMDAYKTDLAKSLVSGIDKANFTGTDRLRLSERIWPSLFDHNMGCTSVVRRGSCILIDIGSFNPRIISLDLLLRLQSDANCDRIQLDKKITVFFSVEPKKAVGKMRHRTFLSQRC